MQRGYFFFSFLTISKLCKLTTPRFYIHENGFIVTISKLGFQFGIEKDFNRPESARFLKFG